MQYAKWIKGVFNKNLGWSTSARMPVSEALARRVPATIELLLAGQVVVFFGGIWLGILSAAHHNRLTDHLIDSLLNGRLDVFMDR